MRHRLIGTTLAVFTIVGAMAGAAAQQSAAPPIPVVSAVPTPTAKLEKLDEQEREIIRLGALVTALQKENAELRTQVQSSNLQTRAAAFIEKMKKVQPDFDVNPETLELTPKKPAAASKP